MPSPATIPSRFQSSLETYRELKLNAGLAAAAYHRRRLRSVTFIGVTGSCGKTTTKELIAAVLGSQLRGRKTPRGQNDLALVGKTILRTSPKDAFCVLEIAAGFEPGRVARKAKVLRPDVAVVTTIGNDHFKTFRTLDAIAAEKRALVEGVTKRGTAVLNADDPRVLAMADGFPGRVLTIGISPAATMRAFDVRCPWPERLSFTLSYQGCTLPVGTRLCGKHWVTSALAALAVATVVGIPLEQAVGALARFEPVPGRMRPVTRGGVTFIDDQVKAPLWSLEAAFEFLADARAPRKIAVIGTISDYGGDSSSKYVRTARRGLEVADELIFVGRNAGLAVKADPEGVRAFRTASEATDYLRSTLQDGDLVLLKGSGATDGLDQVMSAR